jgi:hypothetical protein
MGAARLPTPPFPFAAADSGATPIEPTIKEAATKVSTRVFILLSSRKRQAVFRYRQACKRICTKESALCQNTSINYNSRYDNGMVRCYTTNVKIGSPGGHGGGK